MRLSRSSLSPRLQGWREELREHIGEGASLRVLSGICATYLFAAAVLGIYWSREPKLFAVQQVTAQVLARRDVATAPGIATVATLIRVLSVLLDKPGGFLGNDIAPPGLWLDNMPAWEAGVLMQARDLTHVLRVQFSRAQADVPEDEDLARVEPRLNFSSASWALPSSESEYRDALRYLRNYLQRLQETADSRAQFYARADYLSSWLAVVETRLGSLSQRLSVCVKPSENPSALDAGAMPPPLTPWYKVDDVFYEARGSAWALIHFLQAIDSDFADVLQRQNARQGLREAIRDLEATQAPIYSPLLLNGGGFGMLANHSLVMASYIARANAATINVRERLAAGSY